MELVFRIICLYGTYYTLMYSRKVFKEGNKLAGIFIGIIGLSITIIQFLKVIYDFR